MSPGDLNKKGDKRLSTILTTGVSELSELSEEIGTGADNLEDMYELSPMQQGMLFHTLYSPNSGAYIEQSVFAIEGELDVLALEQAWRRIVERHTILRTSFVWEDLDKPLQIVHRRVNLRLEQHDWRDLSAEERQHRLESLITADLERGFELTVAPLMRLILIRVAEDAYKFIWSRHHLLLDRWSRSVVLKELSALYDAFCKGQEPALRQSRPFGEYIEWISQQDRSDAETYWRRRLKGLIAPTALGIDRETGDTSVQGESYGDQRIALSEAITARLNTLARRNKLTLNTIVQGAWALLLSLYSGERDVVFGATTSGRPPDLSGVESMVGLFINTLPVRIETPSEASLLPWLKKIHEEQIESGQYEYSSLIDIHGWSNVPRGLPLFKSILVFENVPVGNRFPKTGTGLWMRSDGGAGARTGYPLTILVGPDREMSVHMVYNDRQFPPPFIARMLGHFKTLLEAFTENPERLLSGISPLTETERNQLLVEWNDTASGYVNGSCAYRLFEEQARRAPDAVAVTFQNEHLTYRELNERANQLARYLEKRGVGPEALVAISMERSPEMLVGLLGVLKSGGAYVPLDPAYPHERISFMLKDADVSVLLTQERLVESLPQNSGQVVCLDRDWGKIVLESKDDLGDRADADNLAYVIYTSGSTGKPKGVAMTHGPLSNLIYWQIAHSTLPAAKTLQFASLSFDVSFQEIFSTLGSGGTLVLVPEQLRRDGRELLRLLADESVERLFVPFVTLQQLAEAAHGNPSPGCLREIITAGEQLEVTPQIATFMKGLFDCTLYNQYGPSESHVVTEFKLDGSTDELPVLPPIGRPIPGASIYLLGSNLRPVPVGVPGELYIGGPVLARGYINRPELTAERFIVSEFGPHPGARLYRTGDLARYLSNGNIEFLGRIDSQMKIRGFRVEPGELEATLRLHAAVRDVAVAAKASATGGKRLVAYVVADGLQATSARTSLVSELREFMKNKLPEHMIPSAFVILESLPLTPSGKIDRKALPSPDQFQAEPVEVLAGPRDPLEAQLTEIWENLLEVRPIGRQDNFFDLGGHSLLAVRLMNLIEQTYGKKLPLSTLYSGATIERLGQALLDQERAILSSPIVPIKATGSERPFFFLHGDFNGGGFYSLKLARYLDEDHPFYIMQPHGFDGRQVPQTIEAMAASHLKVLRDHQPEGPYRLGGYCNGALVAFEMAQLLHREGQKVELLILIDVSARNVRFRPLRTLIDRMGWLFGLEPDEQFIWFIRFRDHILRLSRMSRWEQVAHIVQGVRKIKKGLAARFSRRNEFGKTHHAPSDEDPALQPAEGSFRHNDEVVLKYKRAMWGYIPQSYNGSLKLFLSSEQLVNSFDDPTNGWRKIAPEVDVFVIPGDHFTSITKYSQVVAEHLNVCLHEVRARDPGRL